MGDHRQAVATEHRDEQGHRRALLGSALFFALAPGVVAGYVPWSLTGWRVQGPLASWAPVRVAGVALLVCALAVLLHAFARFVVEGRGTPAPAAPTQRLVIGGLYRFVRNPMYVAVVALIVGQALALGQPVLVLYAATAGLGMFAFARFWEEPTLARRYGVQYDQYRDAVPGWWPRRRPWAGDPAQATSRRSRDRRSR